MAHLASWDLLELASLTGFLYNCTIMDILKSQYIWYWLGPNGPILYGIFIHGISTVHKNSSFSPTTVQQHPGGRIIRGQLPLVQKLIRILCSMDNLWNLGLFCFSRIPRSILKFSNWDLGLFWFLTTPPTPHLSVWTWSKVLPPFSLESFPTHISVYSIQSVPDEPSGPAKPVKIIFFLKTMIPALKLSKLKTYNLSPTTLKFGEFLGPLTPPIWPMDFRALKLLNLESLGLYKTPIWRRELWGKVL